jgi:hypothetical protein
MCKCRCRTAFPILLAVVLLAAVGCAANSHGGVRSPAQQLENYRYDAASPIASRIGAAPSFVLDYLNNSDKVDSYENYLPTDKELSLARQYFSLLPKEYQAILESHLIGIYFIKGLIGSAITEFVYDKADNPYAFIAFNSATLSTSMSDWVTLRDQSCFKLDNSSTIKLSSDCGNYYAGLMYAILHESSHVVDLVVHYHNGAKPNSERVFPFVGRFWKEFSKTLPQYDFPHRKDLTFYGLNGGPKLSIEDALQAYKELSLTPFSSLYGSQTILEDYAELFTWTYYTNVLHQHYSTTVTKLGQPAYTYNPMENALVIERSIALMRLYL